MQAMPQLNEESAPCLCSQSRNVNLYSELITDHLPSLVSPPPFLSNFLPYSISLKKDPDSKGCLSMFYRNDAWPAELLHHLCLYFGNHHLQFLVHLTISPSFPFLRPFPPIVHLQVYYLSPPRLLMWHSFFSFSPRAFVANSTTQCINETPTGSIHPSLSRICSTPTTFPG